MNDDPDIDFSLLPGICTALTPQKKNPNRYSVFVDDQFLCGAEAKAIRECKLEKGTELNETLIRQLLKLDERLRLNLQCYRWLARRAHSCKELRDKALRKNYTGEIISEVLAELESDGWIDDRTFAQDFAETQFKRKQWGPSKIRSALQQKGIPDPLIYKAVEQLDDESQLDSLLILIRKNRGKLQREADLQKRKHKLVDLLRRKGYHPDVIFRHIDTLTQHLSDETTDI